MKKLSKNALINIIAGVAAVVIAVAIIVPICVLSCGTKPTKYTVSFDTRGGSAVASYSLEAGAAINRPSTVPTKEMFTFDDWYTDTTYKTKFDFNTQMPESDITVYAGWVGEKSVTVTYNANGGTFDGATQKMSQGVVGTALTDISEPAFTGYVFGGWYTDSACTDAFDTGVFPIDNVVVYAKWNKSVYYAYYSYYGNGELLTVVPVKKAETAVAPALFGDDITSAGWFSDAELKYGYTFGAASSDVDLYTAYYTKGLSFTANKVTGYDGASDSVIVPNIHNGTVITNIGAEAFATSLEVAGKVSHIKSVKLPDTVTTIEDRAFSYCNRLTNIDISDKIVYIGNEAFFYNERLTDIGDLSNVVHIGDGAFIGCKALRTVTLSEKLTELGAYAFADCESLTSVTVPLGINVISERLFDGCKRLESVTVNASVLEAIEANAFDGCSALTSITIKSVAVVNDLAISGSYESPFAGCPAELKIYVPQALVQGYVDVFGYLDNNTLQNKFVAIP